ISQSQWNGSGNSYVQLGAVRSRGTELEGRGEIAPGSVLSGALTKLDASVKDEIDSSLIGKSPYATIEDQATLKLAWSPEQIEGLTWRAVCGGAGSVGLTMPTC
ncbi:MAG: hypothetical protein ABIR04_05915, partial [Cypionkella sp.]